VKVIWYPHYLAEYERDTKDLPLLQHGVYRCLMDAYYAERGPLCADPATLYRIARAIAPEEQAAVLAVVKRFFRERDGKIHHKLCDEVLDDMRAKSETARAKSDKRWGSQRARDAAERAAGDAAASAPAHAAENAAGDASHSHSNKEPKPPYKPPKKRSDPTTPSYSEGFDAFWAAYPSTSNGSKRKAWETWDKRGYEALLPTIVNDVQQRILRDRAWREGFIPHAVTYLNQARWEGGIDTTTPGRGDRRSTEQSNETTAELWAKNHPGEDS
jgi:uncharacterized protein YdaU (DUF1376 family)